MKEKVILIAFNMLFIYGLSFTVTSCASARCHTKGVYVDKSIKKAQSKPRRYN